MPISDHVMRYVRRLASPVLSGGEPGSAELAVDATTHALKYHSSGTHEAVALDLTQTITGDKTFSGSSAFTGATAGVRRAVTVGTTAAVALTAAQSGLVYVSTATSGTQVFTLPLAATAGLTYTFVCGHADTEIHIGTGTGDNIITKTSAAEDATGLITTTSTGLLKNTAAGNVVGDHITLVSDGLLSYYGIAQGGAWTAT